MCELPEVGSVVVDHGNLRNSFSGRICSRVGMIYGDGSMDVFFHYCY